MKYEKISRLKQIPLYKLIPSLITVLSLCMGITSIRYALDGKFQAAATLILMSGFLDWVDGYMARHLNSASEFGAQLDSLVDLISFGVAPGIVTYLWSLSSITYRGVGWAIVLLYVSCAALRLARFNTQAKQSTFFVGVPMPPAAVLCITPMMLTFKLLKEYHQNPWFVAVYISIVSAFMISKVHTFSLKNLKISQKYIRPLLFLSALLAASILLEPWIMVPILALLYLVSISISAVICNRKNGCISL